jgi:hypothetical protein
MRTYFLLLFTISTGLLQAQQARVITTQELLKRYRQAVQEQALNRAPVSDSTVLRLLPLYRTHTQPGVYRLRDGMPCIVPDTKDIAAIPNAWPAPRQLPYPATIPNGDKGPQPVPQKELKKDGSR